MVQESPGGEWPDGPSLNFSTNRGQPMGTRGKLGHRTKRCKWLLYNQLILKPCAIS